MSKRTPTMLACALLVAAGLGACGGSSKAPGVQLAPTGGQTSATPTTASLPPALSHKPTVTLPKGPPPSQLVVKDLIKGSGTSAAANGTVTITYTVRNRGSAPSHTAHADTPPPNSAKRFSFGKPSQFALAPVAMMIASVCTA